MPHASDNISVDVANLNQRPVSPTTAMLLATYLRQLKEAEHVVFDDLILAGFNPPHSGSEGRLLQHSGGKYFSHS